jgi:hypothetical protein
MGTPGSPYYQPAIDPATWVFSPFGSYAVALQPNSQQTFDNATSAIGLSGDDSNALKSMMASQAAASGYGSGQPTDAAWITRTVTLTAGSVYQMSWNYIGTDYVPFNDGSVTSLTATAGTSGAAITVNNQSSSYALLGFTNPGTGDYSTGTYGSTGWQISTYEVSQTGDYLLGFAVFNLDDTALSPVLLVDSQPGGTTKNGEDFGAVAPNNPDAPTVPPITEPPATEPPVTEPPATDPPVTDPVVTDPPVTEVPVETDPPATDPVVTDPPVTDAPEEVVTVPATRPRNTTTTIVVSTTTAISTTTVNPAIPEAPSSTVVIDVLPVTGTGTARDVGLALSFVVFGFVLLAVSRIQKRSI